MALHDYRCTCGALRRDVYRSIAVGATADPPTCPRCGAAMTWIPQVGRMDAREPFQKFSFQERQPDGSYRERTIDSLHTLRQVERESEQRARNGEGEAVRFRAWSQDDSNGDVNTFGPDPGQLAKAELDAHAHRLGRPLQGVEAVDAATLGPGVTEDMASPFGDA